MTKRLQTVKATMLADHEVRDASAKNSIWHMNSLLRVCAPD